MFVRLYRETAVVEPSGGTPPASAVPPAGVTPPSGVTPPVASTFAVPESYRDKPYLKGVDSYDKLFSMLDGAQTLIGKRPQGVPAADAKPEEWNSFYDALGRPKTAAEYQYDGAEKIDPNFTGKVSQVFHKHGLTASQAKGLHGDFQALIQETIKEKGLATEANDTNFEDLANKTFGVDKDKILATSKALITKHAPAQFQPLLATLPNEQLIMMAGVLSDIHKQYIKEDVITPGNNNPAPSSEDAIRNEARTLMMLPEYKNEFHPNHQATKDKIQALYDRLPKK